MLINDGRLLMLDEDLLGFNAGGSLNLIQMLRVLPAVECPGDSIKVLEFGAGESTKHLASLLSSAGAPFRYVSYEDDPVFADSVPGVETILWKEFPTQLVEGVFDLVLIDGPAGVDRARWYRKGEVRQRSRSPQVVR